MSNEWDLLASGASGCSLCLSLKALPGGSIPLGRERCEGNRDLFFPTTVNFGTVLYEPYR